MTRNIYLELVLDLRATNFLNCLRRFIALRGQPRYVYSDNATQLKASSKALEQFWNQVIINEDVNTYYAKKGNIWKFITDYATWQGGYY